MENGSLLLAFFTVIVISARVVCLRRGDYKYDQCWWVCDTIIVDCNMIVTHKDQAPHRNPGSGTHEDCRGLARFVPLARFCSSACSSSAARLRFVKLEQVGAVANHQVEGRVFAQRPAVCEARHQTVHQCQAQSRLLAHPVDDHCQCPISHSVYERKLLERKDWSHLETRHVITNNLKRSSHT